MSKLKTSINVKQENYDATKTWISHHQQYNFSQVVDLLLEDKFVKKNDFARNLSKSFDVYDQFKAIMYTCCGDSIRWAAICMANVKERAQLAKIWPEEYKLFVYLVPELYDLEKCIEEWESNKSSKSDNTL